MDALHRLNTLISYVEEHLDGEIDSQMLSRIAACPLAVLQRFFVLTTNVTLTEYIRLRRLARVADAVRGSNARIIDIAITYNYDSADALCVAFKRRYGMTPSAARETNAVLPAYDRISFTPPVVRVKGDARMNQNRKTLGNIHRFMDKYQGQNFVFNGCMAYLMECLGASKDYDYWFFSGVSGDCFTQVYGQDLTRWYQCLSHACFDERLIKRVFDACGYDYTYVSPQSFAANPDKYVKKVVQHIDRGLPVIVKGLNVFWSDRIWLVDEISCVVGYENGGETLLFLPDDTATPTAFSLDIAYALVFVEEKTQAPALPDVYRQAIANIPALNVAPPRDGVSFGVQAFLDWAENIENGRFDDVPTDEIDIWRHYGEYLCIIASNVCCPFFLNRAKELCPDVKELAAIDVVMQKMDADIHAFMGLAGGFDMNKPTLKDREAMRPACEMIRQFAAHYNEFLAIFGPGHAR